MVYCGDVHFKQGAGTEYLVEVKKPVSNLHTREVYSVNAIKKNCQSGSLVGSAGSGEGPNEAQ